MLFSRARGIDYDDLNISTSNGLMIQRVTEYKYHAIWIEEKLTVKFHIDNLESKLRQKVGYFCRNKMIFPTFCMKRVVGAVCMSTLDYDDLTYTHASSSTLKPLDSVCHSALRFIARDDYGTHHCILYDKVVWSSREKQYSLVLFCL